MRISIGCKVFDLEVNLPSGSRRTERFAISVDIRTTLRQKQRIDFTYFRRIPQLLQRLMRRMSDRVRGVV